MVSQWVQSKYSKDAKKWEVLNEGTEYYMGTTGIGACSLVKSEYIPCDPPERWEACTREAVRIDQYGTFHWRSVRDIPGIEWRWAWSEKDPDALVVKRRVP